MKRLIVLGVGSLLAFAPTMASAALRVVLEDRTGAESLLPGQNAYDVFVEPTDNEDEQLFAYGLGVILQKVSGDTPGEVRFTPPFSQVPPENFIFTTSNFTPGSSGPNRVELDAENTGQLLDVTARRAIGRLFLAVDETALGQVYRLSLDQGRTGFGSGDPTRADPILESDLSDTGTLVVVPEPATASLLVLGGLLALRRRRTA